MESRPRSVIGRTYLLLLAALSLVGAFLLIFATGRYGLGATPDSVTYIAVARNILNGVGLVTYDGTPLTFFPPLYPAMLALAAVMFGKDPVSAARLLNAVLFAIIIYLSGILAVRFLSPRRVLAFLASIAVAVSIPLVPVVLTIFSEPLFICFVLVYFLALDHYLSSGSSLSLLIMASAAALACLTRYVGLVLVPAAAISVLAFRPGPLRVRLRDLLGFGILSVLPLAVWTVRNLSVSGTLFGPRVASLHTYGENALASWYSLLAWYLPAGLIPAGSWIVLSVVLLVIVAAAVSRPLRDSLASSLFRSGPFIVFIVLYALFLILSSETAFTQFIDSRYLSPTYVPITLVLLTIGGGLLRPMPPRLSDRLAGVLLSLVLGVWLVYPATVAVSTTQAQLERGRGYTSRGWRDNQAIRYLRDHPGMPQACSIYSSGNDAIYWFTGWLAKPLPSKTTAAGETAVLRALRGVWPAEGKACVIQFDQIDRSPIMFTPKELLGIASLEEKVTLADGAIYILLRK